MLPRRPHPYVALVIIVAAVGLARPTEVQAAFPGSAGRIAFVDYGTGPTPVIATTEPDGTGLLRLTDSTDSPYGDLDPTWSPGGTLLAFSRLDAAGHGDIWLMAAEGTGQRAVIVSSADERDPAWSPDGSKIVYSSHADGDWELYLLDLKSMVKRRLTANTWDDRYPAWTPDGSRIGFGSTEVGGQMLVWMRPDGTDIINFFGGSGPGSNYWYQDWSPDGKRIAFEYNAYVGKHAIYEGPLETGNHVLIADASLFRSNPVYSPAADPSDQTIPYIAYDERLGGLFDVVVAYGGSFGVSRITKDISGEQRQPTWQPIPAFPLVDARFSTFRADIEWVFNEGITKGCSAERYCPADPVTRGQMASFLVRALDLPSTPTDFFTDDNGTTHEVSINRVAAAGITKGCTPTTYCPDADVSRGQMASFLARAFALPATTTDYFPDDNGTTHEANINRVAAAGITSGCTPTTYCPTADVTRGQMAAFLRRALQP
jgi:dipeptidyl aminopeptidase/acylaminoacyl peptidase